MVAILIIGHASQTWRRVRSHYPLMKRGALMRRFVWLGLSVGVGALLASALPDIRRYLRITRM